MSCRPVPLLPRGDHYGRDTSTDCLYGLDERAGDLRGSDAFLGASAQGRGAFTRGFLAVARVESGQGSRPSIVLSVKEPKPTRSCGIQ